VKRNYTVFERLIGLIVVTVVRLQVDRVALDFEVVGFVVDSMIQFHWLCLFLYPKNEELEGSYDFHSQWVLEVAVVGVLLVLGGLVICIVLVVEIIVLVWQRQQRMFSLGFV
jgi:hypothetical protein